MIEHIQTRLFATALSMAVLFLTVQCSSPLPPAVEIIPAPHHYEAGEGTFEISDKTGIVFLHDSLRPLADLLAAQIYHLSGWTVPVSTGRGGGAANTIVLAYNSELQGEEYHLEVSGNVHIKAASYGALAMGAATFVQLFTISDSKLILPEVVIRDRPVYGYRSVMLDLARFWHPVETIKETIDLLWFYKIKYLHLHLSDNRRFTFPMDEFPRLKTIKEDGSREYYTIEELKHLVEYARQRGIAIIPEIDLPGHSAQLWSKYPEVFGSIDPKTGQPRPLHVVNMAKEETYEACGKIIDQLAEVFYTSPYIHFGGDEVYLEALKNTPGYLAYCRENNLQAALAGNADELFCHFINRMHNRVKATGKQSLVWEGFPGTGAGSVSISKDITVIVWNATYNHPGDLVGNGYNVVNSTWIPWYMVGAMNLAPAVEKAYPWKVTQWNHWDDQVEDIEIEPSPHIIGGQVCYWEQNYFKVIPVLRERVPVLSERLWKNDTASGFDDYLWRFAHTNALYEQLFRPISIQAGNLLHEEDQVFDASVDLSINTNAAGEIMYTISNDWGLPSIEKWMTYDGTISLEKSAIITAQLFDDTGQKIGYPGQRYYRKIQPAYTYKVLGPAPSRGWNEMPDFTALKVIRRGVSGKMTSARLEKINQELFAKVKSEGHIETRFPGLYNPYAVELSGNITLPSDGEYEWKIRTWDGLAELYIDDSLVAKGENFKDEPESYNSTHPEGEYSFLIKYYYKHIQNQLSILYKTPAMEDFEPFEDLVLPLDANQ